MAVTLPQDPLAVRFPNIGAVVSEALKYVYVFAGLALLLMLIWGGILLMTAGEDQAKVKEGYGKISAGFIGFAIIFVSYFVVQIVEIMFRVRIL